MGFNSDYPHIVIIDTLDWTISPRNHHMVAEILENRIAVVGTARVCLLALRLSMIGPDMLGVARDASRSCLSVWNCRTTY